MAGSSSSPGSSARLARTVAALSQSISRLGNSGVLRIQQEFRASIQDPVPFIYVSADESNVTKISALIVGPLETPYAGGFFRFEVSVGPDYPMKPPKVRLETTDGGRVRFNPNLYRNGTVCLSILGTWNGPAWSSAETLSSVLLSIQSLMCPQPYHNEPGYETRGGASTTAAYNDYIRYETLRVAVVGNMNHPSYTNHFPEICDRSFLLWYEMYVSIGNDLLARKEGKTYEDPFSSRTGQYALKPIMEGLKEIKERVMAKMQTIDVPVVDSDDGSVPAPEAEKLSRTFAIDRLQDDYHSLLNNPCPGGSASPRDPDNPFVWDATVLGPEDTPWEGGIFSLEIRFSCQHPHQPPFAHFTSKILHPNVTAEGIPALDLIQTRWDSSTKIGTILDELQRLLATPSEVYPINLEAAIMFRLNRREYKRSVRRMVQDGC